MSNKTELRRIDDLIVRFIRIGEYFGQPGGGYSPFVAETINKLKVERAELLSRIGREKRRGK